MALDTAAKRAAALGDGALPPPSGAITARDRAHAVGEYLLVPAPPANAWEDAGVLKTVERGTLMDTAAVPPGVWWLLVRARDRSGNYSDNDAAFAIAVVSTNPVIGGGEQAPRWPGTLTDFIRHDVSGSLIPKSTVLASSLGFELFDSMAPSPVATAIYEAPEIDLGQDSSAARVFGELAAALGSGHTGVADPQFLVDHRLAAGSYDGFEPWSSGEVNARFIKARAKIVTATGVARLTAFAPTVDRAARNEEGQDVVVGVGGASVVFAEPFHAIPKVFLQADGALALVPVKENVSTTGFDVTVYNAAGADVGGTIDWQATGA